MSIFKLQKPAPKRHKGNGNQVAIRLHDDLVKPFRRVFDESGLSLNDFVNSMIRHCIADLLEQEEHKYLKDNNK